MRTMEVGQKITGRAINSTLAGINLMAQKGPRRREWRSQPRQGPATCILYYYFGLRSPLPRRFLTTFIPLADADGRAHDDT